MFTLNPLPRPFSRACRPLLLLLFPILGWGQDENPELPPYQPFVVEGANWIVSVGVEQDDDRAYTLTGDTIIRDTLYKKLYQRTLLREVQLTGDLPPPYSMTFRWAYGIP